MTQNLMAAHMPSNNRVETDSYLLHPSQFNYEENRMTIEDKKQQMEYIEIFDSEIAKVRGEYDEDRGKGYNSLSVGDSVAILLAKEFKEYEGLQDPNEIEIMEEGEPANTRLTEKGLTASSEESIMNTRIASLDVHKKSKSIVDSYRDFDACSTIYFLK